MPGVVADNKARKPTKNEQRRARKKQQKHEAPETSATDASPPLEDAQPNGAVKPTTTATDTFAQDDVVIADPELSPDDPLYEQFASVFTKFQQRDEEEAPAVKEIEQPKVFGDDDENIQGEDEEEETVAKLSKKARKQANKLSIAELKAIVQKPEIVEWTDTSASDPKLLVNIKSSRNVVPVPGHWSLKREYLSSKRGVEKAGFALPKFIAETGISDMRDAVLEKQAEASLKQKQRERVQPKMGKLDIDYQKLYEAFFRRQTKPHLTRYGEVYYEGKEYETNLRHLRPGELSEELKEALNMPPGAPPPWLINQQRFGPPPSYPAMKIPGLNAPPPPGASWGFHPGGYGKAPVDDKGAPLWGGDVHGYGDAATEAAAAQTKAEPPVDKTVWGELQPPQDDEEEEEEEEESDDEEEEDKDDPSAARGAGVATPFAGTETPGGIYSSVPTDLGTQSIAGEFNLRKQRRGTDTEESSHPRSAGQVIGEKSIRAEGFFGGERAYDLSGTKRPAPDVPLLGSEERGGKKRRGDVEVSVDPEALEVGGKEELKRRYEAQREREGGGGWQGGSGGVEREDVSQMVAEEGAKRLRKDRERREKRPLDIPPEDRYGSSRGQSYRPGGARSPRIDSYRTARSPPRRAYVPPGRARSRSPPPRGAIDSYRRRSPDRIDRFRDGRDLGVRPAEIRDGDSYRVPARREEVRREELPRDDLFRREPEREAERDYRRGRDFRDERPAARDERDFRDDRAYPARSPPRYRERERSPLPLKRAREPSPINSRGRRTPPPPAKRERLASPQPRDRYDDYPPSRAESPSRRAEYPRERTPPVRGVTRGYRRADSRSPVRRNESIDPRANDWRRPAARSPSPPTRAAERQAYDDYDDRGRDSVATSRRSSPPVHPSRLGLQPATDDRAAARPAQRDPYDAREPYNRGLRSPEPARPRREASPPPPSSRGPGTYADDRTTYRDPEPRVPPPREPYRNDDLPVRAPPTGPGGHRAAPPTSMAPPSGPASAPISVWAHARAPAAPPSGPRGDAPKGGFGDRGGYGAPRGRGGFGGDFGVRGGYGGGGGEFGGRGGFGGEFAPRGRGGAGPGGFRGRGGGFGRGEGGFGRGQSEGFGRGQSEGFGRGQHEGFGRGQSEGFGRGQGDGYGRGQNFERESDYASPQQQQAPPAGPRSSFSTQPPQQQQSSQPPTPYRQPNNTSSATTYPRTQRFSNTSSQPLPDLSTSTSTATPTGPRSSTLTSATTPSRPSTSFRRPDPPPATPSIHPSLSSLPQPIPGGLKAPALIDRTRLDKLAEETERLRRAIEAKEERKRRGLRDWERLGREARGAELRSGLAEEGLMGVVMEGEREGMGASAF
ncbi:hypothetical protein B0A48_14677 [Cryoendolithus antarcticus]|uniref:PSP proline-rich domain-containing protein n=1 Tax=Cryoendolithus antarcticus TaxID=1507870 RepID=A0A1V8SK57_9PEZI|nr:hypothetical protein B0A48_14677 [Cryoendolithus antarcticus]